MDLYRDVSSCYRSLGCLTTKLESKPCVSVAAGMGQEMLGRRSLKSLALAEPAEAVIVVA